MNCLKCNGPLLINGYCSKCGGNNNFFKKAYNTSDWYYNKGLDKANIRDLTGAIEDLKKALRYNKANTSARNLLGLIYYEMGEVVDALSAWVISVNFQAENNEAADYLKAIQENPTRLNEVNQTIKKYNQTLIYAKQGDIDLALIQLKRVLGMSPNFVNGHLLLALLYIKTENFDRAKREIKRVLKIDANNTLALRYYIEIGGRVSSSRYMEKAAPKPEPKKEEPVKPINELKEIEQERKKGKRNQISVNDMVESSGNKRPILYLIFGLLLGVVVMWVLVVPQKTNVLNDEFKTLKKEYAQDLADKSEKINNLQNQIDSLTKDKEKLATELEKYTGDSATGNIYEELLEAANKYMEKDKEGAGAILLKVDATKVEKGTKAEAMYVYLKEKIYVPLGKQFYNSGYASFSEDDYEKAIKDLECSVQYDDTAVNAWYFLARSYHKSGEEEKAKEIYQRIIKDNQDKDKVDKSEQYLSTIK